MQGLASPSVSNDRSHLTIARLYVLVVLLSAALLAHHLPPAPTEAGGDTVATASSVSDARQPDGRLAEGCDDSAAIAGAGVDGDEVEVRKAAGAERREAVRAAARSEEMRASRQLRHPKMRIGNATDVEVVGEATFVYHRVPGASADSRFTVVLDANHDVVNTVGVMLRERPQPQTVAVKDGAHLADITWQEAMQDGKLVIARGWVLNSDGERVTLDGLDSDEAIDAVQRTEAGSSQVATAGVTTQLVSTASAAMPTTDSAGGAGTIEPVVHRPGSSFWHCLNVTLASMGVSQFMLTFMGIVCAAACATAVGCAPCLLFTAGFAGGTVYAAIRHCQ